MKVTVIKSHLGPAGFVHAGDQIDIDITRHRALARSGIVSPPEGEEPPPAPAGVRHGLTNSDFKARRQKIAQPRTGPSIQQWVSAGYRASGYPPSGHASQSSPEEIAAAVAAEKAADEKAKK